MPIYDNSATLQLPKSMVSTRLLAGVSDAGILVKQIIHQSIIMTIEQGVSERQEPTDGRQERLTVEQVEDRGHSLREAELRLMLALDEAVTRRDGRTQDEVARDVFDIANGLKVLLRTWETLARGASGYYASNPRLLSGAGVLEIRRDLR